MSQVYRPVTIVGNWKMNKTIAEAQLFIKEIAAAAGQTQAAVWLAVPFTAIHASAEAACSTRIVIGAQNASAQESGAFTGEVSCMMLKEAGAAFVILGHSERRTIFHETDAFINEKVKRALKDKLCPVLCVGETLEQHRNGLAEKVIGEQLNKSLKDINGAELQKIVLAYEPVWAIGTNQHAAPEQAQAMHRYCRQVLAGLATEDIAKKISILYGGSVKPDNASDLLAEPDIDGLLVGGSSLSVNAFSKIIECCQTDKTL